MEILLSHWSTFKVATAVIVFIVYVVVDGMYAYYTLAVTEKKAFKSATTGALMHFLIAFGVLSYVENYLYVVPLVLGSWAGTYVVVRKSVTFNHVG
jgi:hypothetical protein